MTLLRKSYEGLEKIVLVMVVGVALSVSGVSAMESTEESAPRELDETTVLLGQDVMFYYGDRDKAVRCFGTVEEISLKDATCTIKVYQKDLQLMRKTFIISGVPLDRIIARTKCSYLSASDSDSE